MDTLIGSSAANTLEGNAGADVLTGGAGDDTLDGGDGNDKIDYYGEILSGGTSGISVNLSTGIATDAFGDTDNISSIEHVRGTTLADTITGNASDSIIEGEDGDDTLFGGAGNDTISGGAGSDVAVFSGSMADYTTSGETSSEFMVDTDGYSNTLDSIETLRFDDGDVTVSGGTQTESDGTQNDEFQVNTHTSNSQAYSSITGLSDGGFVVTWTSVNQFDSHDVVGQRYDSSGQTTGNEFLVNSYTSGVQYSSSVTALSNGGFLVTWNSNNQDGSNVSVYAQRYDALGQEVGDEFKINTYSTSYQRNAEVEALNDGGFIATWESLGQGNSSWGIYGQRFNSSGQKNGAETHITNATFGGSNPDVTVLSNGEFVVTWQSYQQVDNYDIFAQRFDSSGQPIGNQFQINTYSSDSQSDPSITALNDGGFVVVWQSYGQVDLADVFGQRYNASGQAVGNEFQINSHTPDFQDYAEVVALSDGGFVVTWKSGDQDGSGGGIFAQRFDSLGQKNGNEFQVNTYTTSFQYEPSIAALEDGGFVISWQSLHDGSSWGVFAQQFNAVGQTVTSTPITFTGDDTANTLATGDGAQKLVGEGGDDTLSGGAGADILMGDAGNDVLDGGSGADVLNGGDGSDTANYESASAGVTGTLVDTGGNLGDAAGDTYVSIENLKGSAHADNLAGDGGNNELRGGDGDDQLTGGQGNDTIYGGAGSDIAVYSGNMADYTLSGGNGVNAAVSGTDGSDVIDSIETLRFDDGDLTLSGAETLQFSEFQVNTYTDGSQYGPSTTALTDGGFLVTWASYDQDGSAHGIFGQRYNASGSGVGSEFQINTYTPDYQIEPSATALTDGGFLVTWKSDNQDGSSSGIYGQRYDANGLGIGSEFQINTYTTNTQSFPSATALPDGGFVVTWASSYQDGDDYGVYGQRYDANGSSVGSEFQINTYTEDWQYVPSTIALTDGGFLVTWASYGQDGNRNGIYGQRYDANGSSVGSEFQINTYWDGTQTSPSATALADGGFLVTWQSIGQEDGDSYDIYGQRYDENGSGVGSEFQINTYTSNYQSSASATALTDGGFVVTWQSTVQDNSSFGIYGQCYDANGSMVGSEFQINTYTTGSQSDPSVTALTDGGFVVSWTSADQDGNGNGVFAQRYAADGTKTLSGPITLTGNETANVLNAGDGNQGLNGEGGDDTLSGGAGSDTLIGGTGNDVLDGGTGNDILTGGVDNDVYYVDSILDVVMELGGEGFDTVYSSVDMTVAANIEQLLLTGSANLSGTGNASGNVIKGNSGINTLRGDAGADNLYGEAGNDTLYGEVGTDRLYGGDGVDVLWGDVENDFLNGNAGDDELHGGDDRDVLVGDTGNDTLNGDAGTDFLFGDSGEDILNGGTGDDYLRGGADNDTLNGGDDYDRLFGDDGDDTLNGELGDDKLYGGGGVDTLRGNDGHDRLYGDSGNDTLYGGLGNDFLIGNDDNDTLYGEAGSDVLVGANGDDLLFGADGIDYLFGENGSDTLFGGAGMDWLRGGDGSDVLNGGDDKDILHGGDGGDALFGGAGHDILDGAAGIDTMTGGDGDDIYIVNVAGDQVIEVANEGIDSIFAAFDYTLGDHFERLTIYGSIALGATGNGLDNYVTGNANNNGLWGLAGVDKLWGGDGADWMYGGTGDDFLWGEEGNDNLLGEAGNDALIGGNGNDNLYGADGTDDIWGDGGEDRLYGDGGNDNLYGGTGNDFLDGGADDDVMHGEADDDVMVGGDGADMLYGGDGIDRMWGDDGNDRLYGDDGDDELHGGIGDDFLIGNAGDDELHGDAGADIMVGDIGNDQLYGGDGIDQMWGDGGNDTLNGGAGADIVFGGSGSDIFQFTLISDSTSTTRDVIKDFNAGTNTTSVDMFDFSAVTGGASITFLGDENQGFSNSGPSARFNNATKILELDTDGDQSADMEIEVQGVDIGNLDSNDFG